MHRLKVLVNTECLACSGTSIYGPVWGEERLIPGRISTEKHYHPFVPEGHPKLGPLNLESFATTYTTDSDQTCCNLENGPGIEVSVIVAGVSLDDRNEGTLLHQSLSSDKVNKVSRSGQTSHTVILPQIVTLGHPFTRKVLFNEQGIYTVIGLSQESRLPDSSRLLYFGNSFHKTSVKSISFGHPLSHLFTLNLSRKLDKGFLVCI